MDDKQRQILQLLRDNARLPVKTIAGKVGLSRSAVRDRIARLEADGTIRGYRAEIADDTAEQQIGAFLIVRLTKTPARQVINALAGHPAVVRCYSVSGDIDLMVEIRVATPAALNQVRDQLAGMALVASVTTAMILSQDI